MEKIKSYLINILLTIFISFVLICVSALIFAYTNINDRYLQSFVTGSITISSLIGSILFTKKMKKNGIVTGGIFGFSYLVILYFINVFMYSGFFVSNTLLVYLGVCILSGIVGGIIGVNLVK